MTLARKGVLLAIVVLLVLLAAAGAALAAKPKHVMIVVMDQMQPGYAEKYDMANVLWLQDHGVNFDEAYVGDMASETVVSHNVMVSGLLPKHMGWADEVLRDTGNVLGYGAGKIITTGDLGYADYSKLITAAGDYPKLGEYLQAKFPGTVVANVGEKGYQVESMAANSSTYWVRMGSKKAANPALTGLPGSYRGPSGNLPAYISGDPRYYVSVGNDSTAAGFIPPADYYGTKTAKPAWLYPEDGRYVKGPYEGHASGDIWVADAAMAIMDRENWSGLWVTFSAIDKIGHLWGGGAVDNVANYGWEPTSLFDQVHMPWAAKNADDQLGRLIAKLKEKGIFKDTLIVVTADHGSTYGGKGWYGVDAYDGANSAWYYDPNGTCANTAYGRAGANNAAVLAPLNADGNLAYSYQSTAIEAWLIDQSWDKKLVNATAMRTLPGVIATYARDGDHYVLRSTGTMTYRERDWWRHHGQELVDTMAYDGGPDVIGLLGDKVDYAAYGDHGGAQQDVQRIPMAFYMPGIHRDSSNAPFRLVDLMPTVLKAMDIAPTAPMDGRAYHLSEHHRDRHCD
jgi:hypothetical protein